MFWEKDWERKAEIAAKKLAIRRMSKDAQIFVKISVHQGYLIG